MSNDGIIGPAEGAIIGMAFAAADEANEARDAEIAKMRAQLRQRMREGVLCQAFGQAAAELTKEMVRELELEASGTKGVRRLSDPNNVAGRNDAYIERADQIARRLSDGSVGIGAEQKAEMRKMRPLK